MSRTPGASRLLLHWMVLAPLLWGCQSTPARDVSLPLESSVLAVDVLFPAPLSRDPSLVQVFFVKGPIHAGLKQLPELVSPTFVKRSRAYLLDPEPGTYSLVAVSSAFAPPWNEYLIAGVTRTIWSGTSSDATIFPAELIGQTRTTVAPGRVAFMGALRVREGDRLDANAAFQDALQRQLAEHIRPGVTSETGFAGWLKRTNKVDLEKTTLSKQASDLESFFDFALEDLGDSPWVQVIARAADRHTADAVARAPARRRKSAPRETAVAKPPSSAPQVATGEPEALTPPPMPATQPPKPATADPKIATLKLEPATPEPEPLPPLPMRRQVPGLPPDSPLAEIELGMSYHEVREILGPPDDRIDRTTAKAYIPFYNGPGAYLREWIYEGEGRVVFSKHDSSLEVVDVIYAPHEAK